MTSKVKYVLFIQDYLNIEIDLPYEIIPNCFLKKPDEIVINNIESLLKQNGWIEPDFISVDSSPYKMNYTLSEDRNLGYTEFYKSSDWRYYIVEYLGDGSDFKKVNSEFIKLRLAFYLSKQKIHADLFIVLSNEIIKYCEYNSTHLNMYYEGFKEISYFRERLSINNSLNEEYFEEIKYLFELLNTLDSSYSGIVNALENFNGIKNFGLNVSLRYLSYFIIWEQLVTHMPDPKDPTDSIGRQLKSKLNLLNNRAEEKFDFPDLVVGNVSFDKVIAKLYNYRSDLAHGNTPDFKKDYLIFKDKQNLLRILDDITRKLLFASIREPKLIMDLKNC